MKFSEFTYQRREKQEFSSELNRWIEQLTGAGSFSEADEAVAGIFEKLSAWCSGYAIATARMMADVTDLEAKQEMERQTEILAVYYEVTARFYDALLQSKFRAELEASWGKQLFNLAEHSSRIASPDVTEELKLESELQQAYTRLIASARIPFEGEEYNLSGLAPFQEVTDRERRKAAWDARYAFFADKEAELDELFDRLVKVRTTIARKLGFANFVELGYARNKRIGFDAEMVARFREQVAERVVPVMVRVKELQRERLGVEGLRYYDDDVFFATGEPTPKGDPAWLVEQAQTMYDRLSPETGAFFAMMREREVMDLESRPNKAQAGYCDVIPTYGVPFIYSCMNGTSFDVTVLVHEIGHAFQVYETMTNLPKPIYDYLFPTHEGSEIFSHSMEYFAWPSLELFFGEEAEKFRYFQVVKDLRMLLWVAMVDEFQHIVYERPEMTPDDRKQAWRGLELKYMPYLNHEGCEYRLRGAGWHKQSHIFRSPFYYIDYGLAVLVAFQFRQRMNEDHAQAWADYLRIARVGGSASFLELVEMAGMKSPFEPGCLEDVIGDLAEWLEGAQVV